MKIKVITSYKPGTWESYAKKGIESMAEQFPKEVDIVVYAEEPKPQCDHERITWIDLNSAEPELFKFKNNLLQHSTSTILESDRIQSCYHSSYAHCGGSIISRSTN